MALTFLVCMHATAIDAVLTLEPSGKFPRNSEGDFITLESGRILFAYTRFTSGGSDFDKADIAMRYSDDGGASWSETDTVLVENEGDQNTMSVSFLRLQDGRIALLTLRKNSRADCRPMIRFSGDEGATWSEPKLCIDRVGYYVVNNDRIVQLESGRLLIPVSIHAQDGDDFTGRGRASCRISDDAGKTWRWSESILEAPEGSRSGLQEPGIVALPDGRLMMFSRTDQGSQYVSFSEDDGETWSPAEPSELISPVSPATIERLPNGTYLAVYNDHRDIAPELKGKRTPLVLALSDEGVGFEKHSVIEPDPKGWYCYTAMHVHGDHVLLGYCAGDETVGRLNRCKVVRIPLSEFGE